MGAPSCRRGGRCAAPRRSSIAICQVDDPRPARLERLWQRVEEMPLHSPWIELVWLSLWNTLQAVCGIAQLPLVQGLRPLIAEPRLNKASALYRKHNSNPTVSARARRAHAQVSV